MIAQCIVFCMKNYESTNIFNTYTIIYFLNCVLCSCIVKTLSNRKKVLHVWSTSLIFCFYIALIVRYFETYYKGKSLLSEIFRIKAASIVRLSMLAGVVIFSPYNESRERCKLWIYNSLTVLPPLGWNIFDKKLLLPLIIKKKLISAGWYHIIDYYQIGSD